MILISKFRLHCAFILLAFAITGNASVSQAAPYIVDHSQSQLEFSGTHAGKDFNGVFEDWSADIVFDENALDQSHVTLEIKTSSAVTSQKLYDGTLPKNDWFDVTNHPVALFKSSSITSNDNSDGNSNNTYTASGTLAIKTIEHPISFDFTLNPIDDTHVQAKGAFVIKRLDYDIGERSDPSGDWVSLDIAINFDVIAKASRSE